MPDPRFFDTGDPLSLEDLVRLTIYVTDLDDYRRELPAVGEAWRRVLGHVYPCVALVQVWATATMSAK